MARIPLLFGIAVATAACTSPPEQRNRDATPASSPEPQAIAVDLHFARVVERDASVDGLLDFIAGDDGPQKGDGIEVTQQPGSTDEQRVLRGPDQDSLSEYLASVFSRRPELEPPSELQLAFGPAPTPAAGGVSTAVRAYWLRRASRLEVSQVRDATIKQDEYTGQDAFVLTLEDRDKDAFGRLTADAVDHMIAIIVGGDVVSAPVVREPITGGVVQVSMGAVASSRGPGSAEALGRSLFGEEWVRIEGAKREDSIGGLRWVWDRLDSP